MMVKSLKEITHVNILSFSKVQAVIGLVFGLLFGIVNLIDVLFSIKLSFINGLLFIIAPAILLGLMFFILGIIGTWIYNLFASKFGGIKISVK